MVRLTGVMGDDKWSGTGQLANGKWVNWMATKTGYEGGCRYG
jgi:hypothetical protein